MNCGTCTLCCKLLPVKQLNKPHSKLCKFCTHDSCSVYSTRPEECRNFQCHYSSSNHGRIELRPDKTHIVFEKIDNVKAYLALSDPEYLEAYKDEVVEEFCQELLSEGYSILLSSYSSAPKMLRTPVGISTKDMYDKIMKEIS